MGPLSSSQNISHSLQLSKRVINWCTIAAIISKLSKMHHLYQSIKNVKQSHWAWNALGPQFRHDRILLSVWSQIMTSTEIIQALVTQENGGRLRTEITKSRFNERKKNKEWWNRAHILRHKAYFYASVLNICISIRKLMEFRMRK